MRILLIAHFRAVSQTRAGLSALPLLGEWHASADTVNFDSALSGAGFELENRNDGLGLTGMLERVEQMSRRLLAAPSGADSAHLNRVLHRSVRPDQATQPSAGRPSQSRANRDRADNWQLPHAWMGLSIQ